MLAYKIKKGGDNAYEQRCFASAWVSTFFNCTPECDALIATPHCEAIPRIILMLQRQRIDVYERSVSE